MLIESNKNHRDKIVELVKEVSAESVLEVGCGSGRNLKLIQDAIPGIKAVGTDIDTARMQSGRDRKDGTYEMIEQDIRELDFPDKSFDVVFTSAVFLMIDLTPEEIKNIIERMKRIAKKRIILVEFHHDMAGIPGFETQKYRFVRDYKATMKEVGLENIKDIKITKELWDAPMWELYGHFLIVDL